MANLRSILKVAPIPALSDNYMYLVYKEGGKSALAVDPVDPEKIQEEAARLNLTVAGSLVTHHHWDHAGGMKEFRQLWPDKQAVPIFGGDDRIDELDRKVQHEEVITIADVKIRCLATPCHTRGHICYFITTEGNDVPVVLTGDTLFIAGCGKFFEGEASEMQENLNVKLASLPDNTLVYPGHEYTASNLKFALHVEKSNKSVENKLKWATSTECTVPSSIGEEKRINPFMRVNSVDIQTFVGGETDPVQIMHKLREAKNNFKSSI